MKQYPHFLFKKVVTESVQDDTGNWTEPSESWVFQTECREETNGKGQTINGTDGRAVVYSSTIYMPKSSLVIDDGAEILVSETNSSSGFCRVRGVALKFSKGQQNARLWV